ncbi:MAG: hypothetical protein H7323_14705 [Frankiales bacterium]|nr:hypothetical protein [Frankiales bacterium]
MTARRLKLAASALACVAILAACEKPAPIVTVVNEGSSTYAEANTWCFEGQTGANCATRTQGTTSLKVRPGTLGVDVGGQVAKGRWIATLVDTANPSQQLVSSGVVEDKHYYSFALPQLPQQTQLLLTVRSLPVGADETATVARGTWTFLLTNR